MEKKTWSRPTVNVVAFAADEYIAACGKSGKVYLFECSAGRTNWAYNVYLNGADGVAETSDDIQWSVSANQAYRDPDSYIDWRPNSTAVGYHPCGQTHTAESTEEFWNGYMYAWNREDNSFFGDSGAECNSGERIDVIVWGGTNKNNTHCTTNLDIHTWETAKS